MGFFDSEVIQQEAKRLFEDYQFLMKLGGEYGKFDREGKKIFIGKHMPLMSFNSNINYSKSTAYGPNGTFGIKVWVNE